MATIRYRGEDLQLALNSLETIFSLPIKRDLLLFRELYIRLRCNPFTFTNEEPRVGKELVPLT